MTRISQLRTGVLALFLAAGSLTCGGVTPPPDGANALEMAAGNEQAAPVGQPLADPLVVVVRDDAGDPVQGISVGWSAQGGGSVSSSTVTTGSDGRASVTRVLGPTPGQQGTTASVSGATGSPVTFVATATDGAQLPATIEIAANPPVSALTKEVFDPVVQPEVVVKDASGIPVPEVEVTAAIASGSGTLDGTKTAMTNASGVAKFGDLGIEGTGDHTLVFTAGTATVTSSPVALSPLPSEAASGKWGPVVPWDIVPLQMSLLPNGKVFAWGKWDVNGRAGADSAGMPRMWDPAGGPPTGAQKITVNDMLFCAGHTLMPDGRLMVSGGHHMDDAGIKTTYFFDENGGWTKGPDMAHGRWYPTLTVLPDGRVLTMAGRDDAGQIVTTPELWESGAWIQLPGAGGESIPYYPRNFVAPDGRVFMAGERIRSKWFEVDASGVGGGRGRWINGPEHVVKSNRDYGTAAMYEPGKILYAGGGGFPGWSIQSKDPSPAAPLASAERIDLNQTSPQWQSAGSMSAPRRHLNSTILPDGQVLITGGTRGSGLANNDPALGVKEAEVWNPVTGQWTTLAANTKLRGYHSVSLLLPDGTVLHGASGNAGDVGDERTDEKNHEIFSPPYLFKGARPTISSAPSSVGYGQTFSVATPNAAQITDVRWIRLGSVTHAFDMNQRANTLSFTVTATGVDVGAPAGPNLAPPGHYQLFILNRNGVPSKGKIIKVQ